MRSTRLRAAQRAPADCGLLVTAARVASLVLVAFAIRNPQSAIGQEPRGKAIYDKWCADCHGATGAGDGAAQAYMLPRPRDFTKGVYQIRTTASGELPTDADIRRVIDDGMPGTAMPGWRERLTDGERNDVLAYIKSFSQFFAGAAPTAIAIGNAPGSSAEGIAQGARRTRSSSASSVMARRDAVTGRRRQRSTTTGNSQSSPPTSVRAGGSTAAARSRRSTPACARASTARPCRRSAT